MKKAKKTLRKIKKFIKKNKDYFLSLIIPTLIILLLTISLGFYGKLGQSPLVSDLLEQYQAFLTNFKNHGLQIFSFNKSLGGSMIGTIAYYLMSPFNLIVFLFKGSDMYIAASLIIYLKVMFSSLTMCFYLKYHNKKTKRLYLFSACYAFMNFICAYFFNIIWLDAIYLLPLVMYGIDRLINDKKSIYYIMFLMLTILSNYLMGYMICIFSVIYFLYKTFLSKKGFNKKIVGKFIVSSLIAGLLTAFITVPTVMEMFNYSRTISTEITKYKFDFMNVIADVFIGSHNDSAMLSKHKFNIFCGIFCFILIIFYFLNKKIKNKEKMASGLVLLFLFSSLAFKPLYLFWHAFTLPVGFSGRFTFLISFFMITLSVRAFNKIKYSEKKDYMIVAAVIPILGTVTFFSEFSYSEPYKIFLSVIFCFIYLLLLYNINNKDSKKIVKVIIPFLVLSELYINFYLSTYDFKFSYNLETKGNYITETKQIDKLKENDGFFRIEKNYGITYNDSFIYDYFSTVTFSSTLSKNTNEFLDNLGYVVNEVYSHVSKNLPVSDSLLGIKYLISTEENNNYSKIDSFKRSYTTGLFYGVSDIGVNIYENKNSLNLGVATKNDISKCDIKFTSDKISNQNKIVSCLYGENVDLYKKLNFEKNEDVYTVDIEGEKQIYFLPKTEGKEQVKLYIEDNYIGLFDDYNTYIQHLDNKNNILDEVNFRLKSDSDTNLYVYSYNSKKSDKVFKELKESELILDKLDDNYIKASIDVDSDKKYVYTTIPYDKGWKVFVDGKETTYDEVIDTFIGFKLSEGEHIVEFKFIPRGLYLGMIITIISTCFCFVYVKKERK